MEHANLYVVLAMSLELNVSYEKREKQREELLEIIVKDWERQAKVIESQRQPEKTYHGKPYLIKAA